MIVFQTCFIVSHLGMKNIKKLIFYLGQKAEYSVFWNLAFDPYMASGHFCNF